MHVIVTGGGTGGHIFPALEIAHELKKQRPGMRVTYVGNKNSLEEKMARGAGIPFYGLATKKIVGQNFFNKLLAVIFLGLAVLKSMGFLLRDRPQAVVGVGGYISAPVLIASFFLGINRYICEQNAVPGLANKLLALIAKKIFISFDSSRAFFSEDKIILSGNPVRAQFFSHTAKQPGAELKILVTGGSLGAGFLNEQVPKALASIAFDCPMKVTHQIGHKPENTVVSTYQQAGINAQVINFIDNMPEAFKNHDLIISRAGATVCAEIMASGMPAILVPYPFANAHQQHNAMALADKKAAIMVLEDANFLETLAKAVKTLCLSHKKLLEMAANAKNMGTPKAAFVIVSHIK